MDTNQALIEIQRIATIGTLAATFIGGIFGFIGSWIASSLNAKAERKRLLLQLGYEMGVKQWEEYSSHLQKMYDKGFTGKISPPYVYVNFNVRVLELLSSGKLNPETMKTVESELNNILKRYEEKKS